MVDTQRDCLHNGHFINVVEVVLLSSQGKCAPETAEKRMVKSRFLFLVTFFFIPLRQQQNK